MLFGRSKHGDREGTPRFWIGLVCSVKFRLRKMPVMSEGEQKENLDASFRQSRKEFLTMVVAWGVFALWSATYVGLNGSQEEGESLRLVLGMPHWVVFGILVPWVFGLGFTIWFALCFMKDTDLESIEEGGNEGGAE